MAVTQSRAGEGGGLSLGGRCWELRGPPGSPSYTGASPKSEMPGTKSAVRAAGLPRAGGEGVTVGATGTLNRPLTPGLGRGSPHRGGPGACGRMAENGAGRTPSISWVWQRPGAAVTDPTSWAA